MLDWTKSQSKGHFMGLPQQWAALIGTKLITFLPATDHQEVIEVDSYASFMVSMRSPWPQKLL